MLQAVAALSPEALRQALERLQTAEFMYETSLFPDLEYTFRHALIYDVAYRSLSLDRRRALHTAALMAGERLYPDQTLEKSDWLAFMPSRPGMGSRGALFPVRSGASNRARGEPDCGSASGECADRREPLVPAKVVPLSKSICESICGMRLHHWDRCNERSRISATAEALAAGIGDRMRLGRIVSFTANCLVIQANYAEALTTGARALAIAQELHDRTPRGRHPDIHGARPARPGRVPGGDRNAPRDSGAERKTC